MPVEYTVQVIVKQKVSMFENGSEAAAHTTISSELVADAVAADVIQTYKAKLEKKKK